MIMQLVFMVKNNDYYINTYNGQVINPSSSCDIKRFERKNNVTVFSHEIDNNIFYKYKIYVIDEFKIKLSVYKCIYTNDIELEEVYFSIADINHVGIEEYGDCDISFWHEFFATGLGYEKYSENNVEMFSLNDNSMRELRKVFTTQLYPNPFLFFEKYKTLKKYFHKNFDKNDFDISPIKVNKYVGKYLSCNLRRFQKQKEENYAWQREIVIDGEIFWDITVITGIVYDGVMDIKEQHRFFITDGFAYSPDGGDLSVFIYGNVHGDVYWKEMHKKYPNLMLDKYKGKYFYQFFFSREFCPAFEILVKSGFSDIADYLMYDFYNEKNALKETNLYGKNDKEMFGIKLSKLKNISVECYKNPRYGEEYRYYFDDFLKKIKKIDLNNSFLLDIKNIDYNLFCFFIEKENVSSKDVDYLKKIGVEKASLYKDYINMCKRVGKFSGGLYPNDLKHEHDVMVNYMNQLAEAKNNKFFEEIVLSGNYQSLLFEDNEYCVLAPRVANDLVNESYHLSHCVRTYIKSVASGYTRIYFLRLKKQKSKSLVTLEVRNNSLLQARGICNRCVNKEEKIFLEKWCNEKGLKWDIPTF